MRKWIFLLIVAVIISGVWWYLRTYVRYEPEWDKAKFGQVSRGDIRVPITASGLIEANERINIKSEASGRVLEINVVEGDYVQSGDILAVLKKDDEERILAQAQATLKRAEASVTKAEVAVKQAEQNIIKAEAAVEEIRGNAKVIKFDLERAEALRDTSASQKELLSAQAHTQINDAQLVSALANIEVAKNNLIDAQQNVIIQKAALDEAQKQVEDAAERLDETTIRAPQAAIVTQVMVAEGDLVQSATQGFTGGTPVLTLADVSKLKVVTRVDEADIGRVYQISPVDALPEMPYLKEAARENEELLEHRSGIVKLTVDAFPEDTFDGMIERVEPQGKLNQGAAIIQYDVHVEVTDERRYILPLGTQAQVEFTVESVNDALMVPAEAVMTFQNERGIWLKLPASAGSNDPGKKFVPCRFGITDGANTQLIGTLTDEELKEGQEILTKLPRERKEQE